MRDWRGCGLTWLAAIALMALTGAGIWSNRLLGQAIWSEAGLARLAWFSAGYWAVALISGRRACWRGYLRSCA